MKEYRIIELGFSKKNTAEAVMNDMAKNGWRVVSTTYRSGRSIPLLITYEKFGFTVREDLGTRYIMERT